MSRKALKKKLPVEEDEVKFVKRPPQQIPSSNLNEEWASHKPMTSHKYHPRLHYKHECQDEEAVAMEEGVPFEEKEKIRGANNLQNLVAQEEIGIDSPDTSGDQRVLPPSRRPDVCPGADALGAAEHHPAERRRTRFQRPVLPGAFREGGLDNEEEDEEDERTIQSHSVPPIPPTVSAELVDTEEEERRRQDDINQALQTALEREHQLVQDQINQALQREREQAIVAEVIPEVNSKRDRRWEFAGAFFLLVLIVVGVVLGIMLRPDTGAETPISQDLIHFLSNASSDRGEALRNSSTPQYEALMWLAGDANLAIYTNQKKIQRYALATLFYSTKGGGWIHKDKWLSNADVCDIWYQYNYDEEMGDTTIDCTNGAVSSLLLHNNNLSGLIPPEIGMLSDSLDYLDLSENELKGAIPSEIGRLTKLGSALSFQSNALEGSIPTELVQCQNLKEVSFGYNTLAGDIGPIINMLPQSLAALDLSANHFSGTVPTSIGMFTDLYWLDLGGNNMNGTIQTELGLLSNLQRLCLYSNELTGTIPTSLAGLSLLEDLYLYDNDLNGTIPTELALLNNLEVLNLHSNRLTGTVPTGLASLPLLIYLYLHDNDLTGSLEAFCGNNFSYFAANTCEQVEITCNCCNICCEPAPSTNCTELRALST